MIELKPQVQISVKRARADGKEDFWRSRAIKEDRGYLFVLRDVYEAHRASPARPAVALQVLPAVPAEAAPAKPQRGMFGRLVDGAVSAVKTTMGIDRATPAEQAERLAQCATCSYVVKRGGKPYTCGPFLQVIRRSGEQPGCGCLLDLKTRDTAQECPLEGDAKRWHRIIRPSAH